MATLRKRVSELEVEVDELTKDAARNRIEFAKLKSQNDELVRVFKEFQTALWPLFYVGKTHADKLQAHANQISNS